MISPTDRPVRGQKAIPCVVAPSRRKAQEVGVMGDQYALLAACESQLLLIACGAQAGLNGCGNVHTVSAP